MGSRKKILGVYSPILVVHLQVIVYILPHDLQSICSIIILIEPLIPLKGLDSLPVWEKLFCVLFLKTLTF